MKQTIKLELSIEKIVSLMQLGVISGSDLHNIEPSAKPLIQKACLKVCAAKVCHECELSTLCAEPIAHSVSQDAALSM